LTDLVAIRSELHTQVVSTGTIAMSVNTRILAGQPNF